MSTPARNVASNDSPRGRALLHDPANFFSFQLPAVPRRQFVAERDRAFATDADTGEVALDASDVMEIAYPATTPALLARYLVIRAGEEIEAERAASSEILYVLRGAGRSDGHGDRIDWTQGDAFCFPGGAPVVHAATADAILFSVCNEPLLALENLRPPAPGQARLRPLHWAAADVADRYEAMYAKPKPEDASGRALQLSGVDMAPMCHTAPSMNVAFNSLEPGGDQRPHRHNGVAITLAIQGEGVYSMIEEQRVDWVSGAAQVTPATQLHSHHNRGNGRMHSIVIQDEGLHFYLRTPGFSWD